jgi:hypothetical protein
MFLSCCVAAPAIANTTAPATVRVFWLLPRLYVFSLIIDRDNLSDMIAGQIEEIRREEETDLNQWMALDVLMRYCQYRKEQFLASSTYCLLSKMTARRLPVSVGCQLALFRGSTQNSPKRMPLTPIMSMSFSHCHTALLTCVKLPVHARRSRQFLASQSPFSRPLQPDTECELAAEIICRTA